VIFDWNLVELAWRPFLEIAILSVGIYWILMFVRRTRGWPVVLGFLALLGLFAFTMLLDLVVLSDLLRKFFSFSALAILILFNQEIRRMLATIGNFSSIYSVRERRENLETIVQTADRLADVKIGALIAIEQSVDLDLIVESGVLVDCEATAEMLETIFFPNNAIHDGGVIIRGDQIAKAACIFPLTRRKDLNKSLGTRHRAAIGLSEETDAVIVAVSEETGMISHAYRGQLVRGISPDELRSFLTSILVSDSKPRKSLWSRFIREKPTRNTGQPPIPATKAQQS
jgi:diadenylate cyclase